MSDCFCDRCGAYLPEGSERFTVHVQVVSDVAGMVCDGEECDQNCFSMQECADGDAENYDDELYQELSFILCNKCRQRFTQDPFNRGRGMLTTRPAAERMFH
jgi:hypothetical protein